MAVSAYAMESFQQHIIDGVIGMACRNVCKIIQYLQEGHDKEKFFWNIKFDNQKHTTLTWLKQQTQVHVKTAYDGIHN